jgi:hypothetical protein
MGMYRIYGFLKIKQVFNKVSSTGIYQMLFSLFSVHLLIVRNTFKKKWWIKDKNKSYKQGKYVLVARTINHPERSCIKIGKGDQELEKSLEKKRINLEGNTHAQENCPRSNSKQVSYSMEIPKN